MIIAIILSIFHLYTAGFGVLEPLLQRSIHLMFIMPLAYLLFPKFRKTASVKGESIINLLFVILSVVVTSYIILDYARISRRILYVSPLTTLDWVFAILALFLVLEATRRAVGIPMVVLALLALFYSYFGNYIPAPFGHSGVSPSVIIDHLYLATEGIFGMTTGISATYVALFVLFGSILQMTGAGQFFIDLASSLTGRTRGGPAKLAVLASALFGTITGSSVANVYGTGVFTIPMMKKIGYKPHFAGAVEAVASTGGQIMPPIMGAAAFVMADIIGIPYAIIALCAFPAAFFYFFTVGLMVHLEAVKTGLKGLPREQIPSVKKTLKMGGHFLIPLSILIILLAMGYTPFLAAFWATIATFGLAFIRKSPKKAISDIIYAFESAACNVVSVALALATAGIVVGVITMTGLGVTFASMIIRVSGGIYALTVTLVMISNIILGMGLPSTAAYIIVAILGAPALMEFGVPKLAAHMFVFYFAMLAAVTPPVALASFAGANIAQADINKTCLTAIKLGAPAYLAAFMFLISPEILLIGSSVEIAKALLTMFIGGVALAMGLQGYIIRHTSIVERFLLLISVPFLIQRELITSLIGVLFISIALISHSIRIRATTH
ncbi:MAG: TRAP transporter permease [Nitrososphaerota archaeon]|nr:TRAP transporter permease [Nitrososphaerota archaeon]